MSYTLTQVLASISKRRDKNASGIERSRDMSPEKQPGFWMSIRKTKTSVQHTCYLRVSRSKAADVVVDLLKDKPPVHEGETSLQRNKPQRGIFRPQSFFSFFKVGLKSAFTVHKFIL